MSQSQTDWVRVYLGHGARLLSLEDQLQRGGFSPVRLDVRENLQPPGMAGAWEWNDYALLVPREQWDQREAELRRLIPELDHDGGDANLPGDAELQAAAEEDFDVRGCPNCGLFLHDTYARCPGCGSELVPAVEIFAEGQLEPDRVIVANGTTAAMVELRDRLRSAGFAPDAFEVEGWPTDAVDLPWQELIDRTADAEGVLAAR